MKREKNRKKGINILINFIQNKTSNLHAPGLTDLKFNFLHILQLKIIIS
jgi:hypothetical protein